MKYYWELVERFYTGLSPVIPIDRSRGYQLFELCDRRIVVAAFDSITANDCFNFSGAIPRGAVARCDLALRDIGHSYDLRIAVWHHSIHGPPLKDDYMEVSQVLQMAGLGFQLGLHGHQHVAAAETHYVHLSEQQSMAVISAGSLCAGSRELPRGVNRQYNVIVIENDFARARVHVREMVEGEQFSRKGSGAFSTGFVEVNWRAPTDVMGNVVSASLENIRRSTIQAEQELQARHPAKALKYLEGIKLHPDSHARRVAIQAAIDLDDPKRLIEIIRRPHSVEEAILFASAHIKMRSVEEAEVILRDWAEIDVATRNVLVEKIQAMRMMGRS